MPSLAGLAALLDERLHTHRYPDDTNGVIHPSPRPVQRLGLALAPSAGLAGWVRAERLDALLLHRPWGLDPTIPAAGVGVLACHLPFDDHLTLGHNPALAAVLDLADPEPFAERDGRVLGMVCDFGGTFVELWGRVRAQFGEPEAVELPRRDPPGRVAVVGAMTDALVRDAARRGAGAYLSGQRRRPAEEALRETGIGLLAAGHAAPERWGLGALAALLRRRWPALEVVIHPPDAPPAQNA